VDSSHHVCEACSVVTAAAFAELRTLTTALGRGEIDVSTFRVLTGDVLLQYDMSVAHRKLQAQVAKIAESGGSGAGRHYLREENRLHNPSCGCDWCQMEPVGNYRGNLPEPDRSSESKAEE